MKNFLKSILSFFNLYKKSLDENHKLREMIVSINSEKNQFMNLYYRNNDKCSNCEYNTKENNRFQKEVIILKQLIEEKNLVIDKLISLEHSLSKIKELKNES